MNLTQHSLTAEQISGNECFRIESVPGDVINDRLTFNEIPTVEEMAERALDISRIAAQHSVEAAVIGGAPYFMPFLEKALIKLDIIPLYSFSKRESIERKNPDGTVIKTSVFKHIGWVKADPSVYEGY